MATVGAAGKSNRGCYWSDGVTAATGCYRDAG